jgi:hypothetical protein
LNFCRHISETSFTILRRSTHVQALRIPTQDTGKVKLLHLLLQSTGKTRVHARATGKDDVLVEIGANVDGGGLDRAEKHLGDSGLFNVDEVGLEHAFRGFEALRPNFDRPAVGERIALYQDGGLFREFGILFEIVAGVVRIRGSCREAHGRT